MTESDLAELGREESVDLILKQAAAIAASEARIDELTRAGKRQAAPSSEGTRVEGPKRPGRKPGQGTFKTRETPTPERLFGPPIDVSVAEPTCPDCGCGDGWT